MGRVNDFEVELIKRTKTKYGRWYRVDLHNHCPKGIDYRYKESDAEVKIAESIIKNDLAIVMFVDHDRLPDQSFATKLAERTGRLILRGVELNVFVDAFDKKVDKVDKDLYYHLLVGFDPDGRNPPDYWLQEILRRCPPEERVSNGSKVLGLTASPEQLADVLEESRAIILPAHLHKGSDAAKSRSIDVIYADPMFLRHAKRVFTALEVTDIKTAAFFDGKHPETENLNKTCIRSSDSHEPNSLGWRHSFAMMEVPSYSELRAALDLPFRISLAKPAMPESYLIGMQIKGAFFQDLWLSLSKYCNVLIGVKGSGKTSVLECLRFALGAEVPESRASSVKEHLSAILGPAGVVSVLIQRADGIKLLVERAISDKAFNITFEDDRQEKLNSSEGLLFPTHILGWHEIEQAATDSNVRRLYMDAIAGKARIGKLEDEAKAIATLIRERHSHTSQRYGIYRDLDQQVRRLQELRKGLQELTDSSLIALRDQYKNATDQREAINRACERLELASAKSSVHIQKILSGQERSFSNTESPLAEQIGEAQKCLDETFSALETKSQELSSILAKNADLLKKELSRIEIIFQEFLKKYATETDVLTPEKKRLLETHREVLEQTKSLASLESERNAIKEEILGLLQELTQACDQLASKLDERTRIRKERTDTLNSQLSEFGVRLTVIPQQQSQEFQDLSARYSAGLRALQDLRTKVPERLAHLCLKKAYGTLFTSFDIDYGKLLFDSAELGYFLSVFENDDLRIELKVGKTGQEYSPINQLSAGQRCTAIFPILLQLGEGALIIDQPEDNLDNRHIANYIGPALLQHKQTRQMIFTSHNANLVVLSDAESILMFESDGTKGRLEKQGFLAAVSSEITKFVMDVLDGGELALQLRARKYGMGVK